uniref:Reverse transcriptase zinc-binding domain-containing protein n=1 Tax=Medicago truncatula TaxID=3880 RepID=Q2HSY1_MEDTR|nr:hypothetical protein MtrDRAFT_AC150889g21v2 [Medicago truncatula]
MSLRDNLVRRNVLSHNDAACVAGCGRSESTTHLFLNCDVFGSLWSYVSLWLGIPLVTPGDLHQHFIQFINMSGLPRSTELFFKVIWFTSVWIIWKERNDRVFNNKASIPSVLIEKVKLTSFMWLQSNQASFIYSYHDWWNNPLLCMGVHL